MSNTFCDQRLCWAWSYIWLYVLSVFFFFFFDHRAVSLVDDAQASCVASHILSLCTLTMTTTGGTHKVVGLMHATRQDSPELRRGGVIQTRWVGFNTIAHRHTHMSKLYFVFRWKRWWMRRTQLTLSPFAGWLRALFFFVTAFCTFFEHSLCPQHSLCHGSCYLLCLSSWCCVHAKDAQVFVHATFILLHTCAAVHFSNVVMFITLPNCTQYKSAQLHMHSQGARGRAVVEYQKHNAVASANTYSVGLNGVAQSKVLAKWPETELMKGNGPCQIRVTLQTIMATTFGYMHIFGIVGLHSEQLCHNLVGMCSSALFKAFKSFFFYVFLNIVVSLPQALATPARLLLYDGCWQSHTPQHPQCITFAKGPKGGLNEGAWNIGLAMKVCTVIILACPRWRWSLQRQHLARAHTTTIIYHWATLTTTIQQCLVKGLLAKNMDWHCFMLSVLNMMVDFQQHCAQLCAQALER